MEHHQSTIVDVLRQSLPGLMAVYAFGSRVHDTADQSSDLDLAALGDGYIDVHTLWDLGARIADIVGFDVDLLDLRAASTVMQYQILARGERWWCGDPRAGLFEAAMLSEKTELDRARADLLDQIKAEGRVHGR
ncbi:MAG: nucleotidyltransferase domain-containing protein [Wenzhouxiangellaceae bacterium]